MSLLTWLKNLLPSNKELTERTIKPKRKSPKRHLVKEHYYFRKTGKAVIVPEHWHGRNDDKKD